MCYVVNNTINDMVEKYKTNLYCIYYFYHLFFDFLIRARQRGKKSFSSKLIVGSRKFALYSHVIRFYFLYIFLYHFLNKYIYLSVHFFFYWTQTQCAAQKNLARYIISISNYCRVQSTARFNAFTDRFVWHTG